MVHASTKPTFSQMELSVGEWGSQNIGSLESIPLEPIGVCKVPYNFGCFSIFSAHMSDGGRVNDCSLV